MSPSQKRSSQSNLPTIVTILILLVGAGIYNLFLREQPTRKAAEAIHSGPLIMVTIIPPTGTAQPATPQSGAVGSNSGTTRRNFDYYVLALSWSPDYCASNGSQDPQECAIGKKLGFVLHGLWPQNEVGYPSNCSIEKLSRAVKAQFPNLYPNDSLYDHEWEKHGTCTGLSASQYLGLAKQLKDSVSIPADFQAPQKPFRSTLNQVKQEFAQANPGFAAADFEASCSDSGRYLEELYVCFSRDGQPMTCSSDLHKNTLKSCDHSDFLVRNTK